jgi:hypothetical protein
VVRILPTPPRSLSNLQFSPRRPRSPPLAGCCGYVSVSAETVSGLMAILGGLSLGRGIPFPRCRLILDEAGPNVVAKPAMAGWGTHYRTTTRRAQSPPRHRLGVRSCLHRRRLARRLRAGHGQPAQRECGRPPGSRCGRFSGPRNPVSSYLPFSSGRCTFGRHGTALHYPVSLSNPLRGLAWEIRLTYFRRAPM